MPRPRRGQPVGEIRPGTMKRFIKYLTDHYKGRLLVVLVCIILSAISMSFSNVFLQQLIDQVILPGMKVGMDSVQAKFLRIIGTMGVFYLVGMATSAIYTQIMAGVTQGTLKNLRDEMFDAMEKLPIKYFDTHAHGDIMSTYTNDVDAIRQMIGQSTPTLIQTGLSVLTIVFMMLRYSLWLTLVVFAVILLMFRVTKKLGKESSVYMMRQQKSLAKEEGFIEEMMKGQKVVKVFTHEEESKKEFDALNEQLFQDSARANAAGNVLMPILGNIGNILYVLLALVGGLLVVFGATNVSLRGFRPITIGIIVSFLGMSRQLSQTIGQMSAQVPMISMALAGAGRVFRDRSEYGDVGLETHDSGLRGTPVHRSKRRRAPARCGLRIHSGKTGAPRRKPVRETGSENCFCRRYGCGQNHHHQPDQPFLRHRGLQNPLRWNQHQPHLQTGSSPFPGHRAPGREPVHRNGDGQYPIRTAGCHR